MNTDQDLLDRLREGMSRPRIPVTGDEAKARVAEYAATPRKRDRLRLSRPWVIAWSTCTVLLVFALVLFAAVPKHTVTPSKPQIHKVHRSVEKGLSDRFEPTMSQVIAGRSEIIYLVVTNLGGTVRIPQNCPPFLQVVLKKGRLSIYPTNGAVECNEPPFIIKHGVHRFPITLSTSYNICNQSPPYSVNMPECPRSGMPPLPVGTYTVTLQWLASVFKPLPDPKPVYVTVIR